jgi:hypothetical protein
MRKFFLYFLLILLLVAVGTFFFGFWNAKKIRSFAVELSAIRANHDFSSQVEEISLSFSDSGKKDVAAIREDSKRLGEKLNSIITQSNSAGREVEALSASGATRPVKDEAVSYFSEVNQQATDLKGVIGFVGQIIEVAAVFGEIGDSTNLEAMKSLIGKAKEKSGAVQAEILPAEIQESAQALRGSMDVFLSKMEEVATLASQDMSQLGTAYADFSAKENEFFSAAKKHIGQMEDLNAMEKRMNLNIERLGKVRFSLK